MITLMLTCAVIYLVLRSIWKKLKYNFPPGPIGLPILGTIHQLIGENPHLKFAKFASKYGKLFTVHLGPQPVLLINDARLMKQLFSKNTANGRVYSKTLNKLVWSGKYGLGGAEGSDWLEQKRFFHQALKEFQIQNPNILEPLALENVEHVFRNFETQQKNNKNGQIFLNKIFKQSTGNFLWSFITGESLREEDSIKMSTLLNDSMAQIPVLVKSGVAFIPWLKYIAPVSTGYKKFRETCQETRKYVENTFEKHSRNLKKFNLPRDIVDMYINRVETCEDKNSSFFGKIGWKHSFASVKVLMVGGADSTGIMLNWIIFCLVVYPKVEEELWKEIDEIIGKDRDPCLADKSRMPFLEAVILEILRFRTLSALGSPHTLTEDFTFEGYNLPKGMILLPNLYFAHNDPKIWKDPENFRPQRFLEDPTLKDFVVAFVPGKRSCSGRYIARDLLFLFTAKIVQKFKFFGDENVAESEYLEATSGFFLYAKHLPVLVSKRN